MKKFVVTVNGTAYDVEINEVGGATPVATAPAPKVAPAAPAATPAPSATPAAAVSAAGGSQVTAPMPGKILDVKVANGDAVKAGDVLLILEAMKMQNEIAAPCDGTVADVRVSANQNVATGDVMVVIG